MSLFIVIIQLPEQSLSFVSHLGSIGEAKQLTVETYLLASPLKASEVRDYIMATIRPLRAYVTKVAHGAAWNNVICSNSDIKEFYNNYINGRPSDIRFPHL